MRSATDLMDEALALPVEERVRLVDVLLRSLNPDAQAPDRAWVDEAARRLQELRDGRVAAVPGEEVLARARARVRR